ncbi:hypothetical protein GCM10010841_12850 [Deinococcus aerophilus]|uniref:Uncharacterized protein n=1 Tax=Deinococcus aerophilus TaxID=522488 RepID=A0ABQ2GQG0_9DEIO|nr:hypothetical protein GCM10010841_12850 [Deinococcus aerophilus]
MGRGAALALALAGGAGAATVEFGVSYAAGIAGGGGAQVGISGLEALGGRISAGLSTRAATVGYARGLALPPLGAATVNGTVALAWRGGVRADLRGTATVGPVALNLGLGAFTTSAASTDPLSVWALTPPDARDRGLSADLSARYRLSRSLILVAGGELSVQTQGFVGVEGRRDLTRPVPPQEGTGAAASDSTANDPAEAETTEPETEPVGTLNWRAGVRAGQGVLGVTAGVGYAAESGLNLGLDALVGPRTFGITGSVGAPDVLGAGSTLRLYAAYEPWRTSGAPLRTGVEATLPVGSGEFGLNLGGGRTGADTLGYAARVTYRLPLESVSQP